MVQDRQVRKLHMLKTREETLEAAAAKSGMDEKTARKYLRSGMLPSQSRIPHTWKTRKDPFEDVWEDVRKRLGTALNSWESTLLPWPGGRKRNIIRLAQRLKNLMLIS